MLNKIAKWFLILAIFCYVASLIAGKAFVYILCFLIIIASVLFGLLVLVLNFVWKLISENFKTKNKLKRSRFNAVVFFSIILFYIATGAIGELLLPTAPALTATVAASATLIFTAFCGWVLIRRGNPKTIAAAGVIFVLLIVLLSIAGSVSMTSDQIAKDDSIQKLSSIPYLDWVPAAEDIEKTGVTKYDPRLAFEGFNLYCSQVSPEAYLIDMKGNVVHKWFSRIEGCDNWKDHVEMYGNGDLLVVVDSGMLILLDWNSNVKWKKKILVHHDAYIGKDGKIHVLAKEYGLVFWHQIPVPICNDYIAVISPDGHILQKSYIYDFTKDQIAPSSIADIYKGVLQALRPRSVAKLIMLRFTALTKDMIMTTDKNSGKMYYTIDFIHVNSIEIMDREIKGFCQKGDWLISLRPLNLIGVVDHVTKDFVWQWGPGHVQWPHHPTLLDNDNLLIFDNGPERKFSRVIELNPLTKEIVWQYKSHPQADFYSSERGGNQRLENGNTLITESERGRAFEITREGRIVWEFFSPLAKKDDKTRPAIYRMVRITDPQIYKLIEDK